MKKIVLSSLVASSLVMGVGYKIPETSTNSVAFSGANIAHVNSAEAAYDNPANMVFMDDKNHMEANLIYINTSPTKFKGTTAGVPLDTNAEEQNFLLPSLHYVSPSLGDSGARVGVSVVVPGGLTREWKEGAAKTVSEEFTLQIVEVNPTAAFKVSDTLGVAVGFRIVHTSGVVKSDGIVAQTGATTFLGASRDMTGDALDFGYNLALAYKPTTNLELGLTYRSQVSLNVTGNANLNSTAIDTSVPSITSIGSYNGGASVSIPLPASLNAAIAYTLPTKTTFEFVYEKTYWSAYQNLDFDYESALPNSVLIRAFDDPKAKNWKDTNAYRIGVTQAYDKATIMAGFVYDETAVPEETLNFESPGSASMSFSLGGRYKIDDNLDVGLSALYSMKENRTIDATVNTNGIDGEFTNSNVLIVSAGVGYKF